MPGNYNFFQSWIEKIWYTPSPRGRYRFFIFLLWPLAKLTEVVTRRRYQHFLQQKKLLHAPVPIIIVGNITVGGTGKTPLVIALVKKLLEAGYSPGVISRGYGAQANDYPLQVQHESTAEQVGDEPLLIYQQTQVPVVIDPQRVRAWQFLLQKNPSVNVIISDDGLQHYALARDVEIVVMDGARGFGNQLCLPAGPLREPLDRLNTVDFLVVNSVNRPACHFEQSEKSPEISHCVRDDSLLNAISMHLNSEGFFSVKNNQPISASYFHDKRCYEVAGIGNPQRFFNRLREQLIESEAFIFPDHHAYTEKDFSDFSLERPVIMTEKDAVKCRAFAQENWVYLKVSAQLPESFWQGLLGLLRNLSSRSP